MRINLYNYIYGLHLVHSILFIVLFGVCTYGQSLSESKIYSISDSWIFTQNGDSVYLNGLQDDSIQVLFFIKHAEEDEIGLDPGLIEIGKLRANTLKNLFQGVKLGKIYGILYRRTWLTIRPLIKDKDLKMDHYDPGEIEYLVKSKFPRYVSNSLIVGTGKTIGGLVFQLTGINPEPFGEKEYDRMIIIERKGSDIISTSTFRY